MAALYVWLTTSTSRRRGELVVEFQCLHLILHGVDVFLTRPPRNPALAPFVESLWAHRGQLAHRFERVLPSGRMQLLVNLDEDVLRDYTLDGSAANSTRGAGVQGARTTPMVIDTVGQRAICGVCFVPGGAWPLFGVPACEVTGQVVDLSEFWGHASSVVRERLLEARNCAAQLDVLETALLEHGRSANRSDRAIETACELLAGGASVRVVGDRLGVTPHRFIQQFRKHIGMRPKLFARIMRFQRLLTTIDRDVCWAELATRNGFSDQAHLIREFTVFAGTTPTAYRARSSRARNHVPLET